MWTAERTFRPSAGCLTCPNAATPTPSSSSNRFIRHLPMRKLEEWLALDPLNPGQIYDRPLRVSLGFKPRCANDFSFLKDPEPLPRGHALASRRFRPSGATRLDAERCRGEAGIEQGRRPLLRAVIERNGHPLCVQRKHRPGPVRPVRHPSSFKCWTRTRTRRLVRPDRRWRDARAVHQTFGGDPRRGSLAGGTRTVTDERTPLWPIRPDS